jgi:hypothetical protein
VYRDNAGAETEMIEGEESLNGKPALVYTYKVVTVVGNFPTKRKIWVSKSSGIPMKSFVEYSNGPIKTLTNTSTLNRR